VVSIDVLQLVEDQLAMLREAARLVRPGGRLVFTTWEGRDPAPDRFPRDVTALVENAGLTVDAVTEQPAWQRRPDDLYARAMAADPEPAVARLAEEGRQGQEWHHALRRVLVTAHRLST
ncbi:MAG TPA: methyltransferase domain-containing protein, partial [Pseudonocardiaceae bacterium]|nr:methyltransferase domain-containing protein [Pseudonocardiaceae bacterium]